MSKSIVYGANTNSQSVPTNGVINFGNAVRRYGCNCNMSGGNAEVKGSGYYDIQTNVTLSATAGTATITLYKDGVAIPGATASLTTIADTIYALSIPAVIKENCDCTGTITAILTGVTGTITNASIVVSKF